jgi:hypothetical protein
MSLLSDLIQHVIALGTPAATRVHDEQVPQGVTLPFVALTEISGNRPVSITGAGLLRRSTVRIAVFGRTAVERDQICEALIPDLTAVRGMMGSTNVSSIRVEISADEVALSDGDNVIKGKGLDIFVVYY